MTEEAMILRSEFAHVRIELDNQGNGPRLMIRDERNHQAIYLDPLELASLAACQHEDLGSLVDPSWRSEEADDFSGLLEELSESKELL